MSEWKTLYREIDALGGSSASSWEKGYEQALTDVLSILTKRGHSEHCDPSLDALVTLNDAGRTAWHFQHRDTNATHGFAAALTIARNAIARARGEAQ